jgi:hypothetical protein
VLAKVDSAGMLVVGNTTGTIQVASSGTTGVFPSTGAGLELVAGILSATDLIQSYNRGTSAFRTIQYRALSHNFYVGSSGTVALQVNSSGAGINITPGGTSLAVLAVSASTVGTIIRGASSQTANLQQWQNSAGTVLSGINAAGQIHTGTTASINGSIFTQITNRSYTGSSTVETFEYSGTSLVQVGQRVTLRDFQYGFEDFNGTWTVTAVTSNSFTVVGSGFPSSIFGTLGRFTVSSTASFVANTAATTPVVVKGVASQTANLQEWQNSTGSPLLWINSDGQIQAPKQSSSVAVKASPTRTATITSVSGNGTYVDYNATNTFTVGEIVTITGVNPAAYNLSSVVISQAAGTFFSVENAATGTYVSGGTATVEQIANLQEWQNGSGTLLSAIDKAGNLTKGDGDQLVLASQIFG